MAVTISTNELKETLEFIPSTQNIMLVGKHGIGKSEILISYFLNQGMKGLKGFILVAAQLLYVLTSGTKILINSVEKAK